MPSTYTVLFAIVLIVAAPILAVVLVMKVGRRTTEPRTRIDVRVGRFVVTAGGADRAGDRIERCAAWAVSDLRDPSLVATVGVAAVMADASGAPSGHSVASAAVDSFLQSVSRSVTTAESVTEVLKSALLGASEHLVQCGDASSQSSPGVGAVAVTPSGLYWASAGDVRVYLVRARAAWRVNRELCEPSASETTAGSARFIREVDIAPAALPLQAGDYVLVCNAGLHSRLTEDAIARGIAEHGLDCSRALVEAVSALDDGATLVAIHLGIREYGHALC